MGEPGTTTFTINWLTDIDPLAQCNDGSPAAYYYAKGTGSSADLWVVYLEGSMFCWGQASCSGASLASAEDGDRALCSLAHASRATPDRYATHDYWMSSRAKPWQPNFAQGGIFATDGSSAWGQANRVYVKCVGLVAIRRVPGRVSSRCVLMCLVR